ncbi:uncharacterized protein MELLADRAFT_110065 [Melampsora larici-populina 98AG31]|uniref:Btz domain-containing protein n=1 Tax=Melampsora larici-populina (strain 98AG31 / pathotype 3-4-7) TaxID=747676 RepID=F4RYJ6_MELLP|nr:uncharacterized protein MELLADRAFT_110065 [Melampsora larici-populina 98AG31]EGG02566.1 hypothetical protein MELLADRAFT_110065 [Melampsora larici-populina 98AG31]
MDSDEFQKRIDEQVRNICDERNEKAEGTSRREQEEENVGAGNLGEKGKGVEAGEEEEEQEEDQEGSKSEQKKIGTIKSTRQPRTKTPATRQSKRKNGQPPEGESQLVGPVRIKKPRGKTEGVVNDSQPMGSNNATPTMTTQATHQPSNRLTTTTEPRQHELDNQDAEQDTEGESAEEDENKGRILGGIYLDDDTNDANAQSKETAPMSMEDRMSQRLDIEIDAAFAANDRKLYDQLVGEDEDMADIGVRNKKIERRAERQTVMRNDDLFLDNPYAYGQSKRNIDPIDGSNWEGKPTAWDDPSRGESKEEKSDSVKNSQSNYIPNYRPSFRGGRSAGPDGGSGSGHGGVGQSQGSWGRGKQGEEGSNHQNQGSQKGGGSAGQGYAQKK